MFRLPSVSSQGLKRIAQEMGEGSGKAVVESVEKFASSGSGYVQGGDYDEVLGWPIEKLVDGSEITPAMAMAVLNEEIELSDVTFGNIDWDDPDEDTPEDPEEKYAGVTAKDVLDAAREKGIGGDTTYNWGWWGPDCTFLYFGGEIYEGQEAIVLADRGTGFSSDPYMAVVESYESFAWDDWSLQAVIKTDKGNISVDSTDKEGYHFYVHEDETGLFEEGSDISYPDLEEKLEGLDMKFW